MNINFSMWKTALTTLIKMEDKHEWDGLDVVSKWLIASSLPGARVIFPGFPG
jgi:hypothetical protein